MNGHYPWHVTQRDDGEHAEYHCIEGASGVHIADVSGIDFANLIASAPDLLAAVHLAMPYVVNYSGNRELVDTLLAAMRKAEGRQ